MANDGLNLSVDFLDGLGDRLDNGRLVFPSSILHTDIELPAPEGCSRVDALDDDDQTLNVASLQPFLDLILYGRQVVEQALVGSRHDG